MSSWRRKVRSKLRTPVPELHLLTEYVRNVHVAVDGQFSTSKLAAGDNGDMFVLSHGHHQQGSLGLS